MPHPHFHSAPMKKLILSCILTLVFVGVELFTGTIAHSLALVSDAGHNFADALALLLSLGAVKVAQTTATSKKSFGYHRVTILAAIINALALVLIALYIFWEAYRRLGEPQNVDSNLMIGVAFIALILNGTISYWLRNDTHDLNTRSAYVHMLGDALAAIGVILAGILILFTNAYWIDSFVSVLIGVFILWSSWDILREGVDVLLEAAPKGLDVEAIENAIKQSVGVLAIHDLHIWTISSGMFACSCHIVVSKNTIEEGQQVIKTIIGELQSRFHIGHTTIQIEVEGCDPNDVYCSISTRKH